ncbi:hypothetical protein O9992_03000 [Vibrio lentus]|nr:hypothetical protein [Vibrio lentus]
MCEDIDAGRPTVIRRPDSEHTRHYLELAENVAAKSMFLDGKARPEAINFSMVD